MLFALESGQIALALAIIFVATVLQGASGIGYALVSAPLLVLIHPTLAPGPVLASGILLMVLMIYRERRHLEWGEIGWLLLGYIPGALLAGRILAVLAAELLSLLFASLVLLAVLLSLLRWRVAFNVRNLTVAGLLSGFMGTASSISGPPVALLYQHEAGSRIRGNFALYFLVGSSVSLLSLALARRFNGLDLGRSVLLLPAVLLGYPLSGRLAPILDRGFIRPLLLALCALSATMVLWRVLQGA